MVSSIIVLDPTPETLDRATDRAYEFLRGVSDHAAIARKLERRGLVRGERRIGWGLRCRMCSVRRTPSPGSGNRSLALAPKRCGWRGVEVPVLRCTTSCRRAIVDATDGQCRSVRLFHRW